MTRPKTISDDDILVVARKVFRDKGHAASTREISLEVGISEGVLYQRFGSKDDLFFAAMLPSAPDIEELLGPEHPSGDVLGYLQSVLIKMVVYFGEVIPLALRVMTHPSFDHATIGRAMAGAVRVHEALARRLAWFETKKLIRKSTAQATASVLVSVAHDAGLSGMSRASELKAKELDAIATLLWNGIAPSERTNPSRK